MASEKYELGSWDLGELFVGFEDPQIEEIWQEIEAKVEGVERARGQLETGPSPEQLRELLELYEAVDRMISRLAGYAALRFSEDTQNQRAQTFEAKVRQRIAEIENRTLFFKLWWKKLAAEEAERLLPAAGDYQYWLEALRLQSPYTLTEPEEKVINLKDVNGSQALVTLYQSITNRYTFKLMVDGEEKELTRGELSRYVWEPDPDLRKAAYQELHRVFGQDAPVLGQIYQFVARDWFSELVRLRGYRSPIAVRNLANDVPDEVVEALLEVCQQNAPLFQRFFELKAQWLGMDKLRRYDVYAPVAEADKDYDFEEAIELVLASYREFDPEVARLAQRVMVENHLDSEIRKGKRSGAFCATITPDLTPYVLASYQGKARDVATLAHELGHAVHSMLASDHTSLTQNASLPLAETASTFGEMLVVDRLLAQEPDPGVQRDLLFRQMDDNYATIMRQAYFASFELAAHEAIQEGASVDDLSDLYLQSLQEQFGDAVSIGEDFRHEWVAIPHFFGSPFYVYAYAFGQLLVLALYQRYQVEGEAFKPAYLDILRAGGSAAPMEILDNAGVDVREPAFWAGGFDVLGGILDQLAELETSEAS